MSSRLRQSGMSMFGIVIVMMIVGVLTATVAPFLLSQQTSFSQQSDLAALEAAKTAVIGYAMSTGKLPAPVSGAMPPSAGTGAVPGLGVNNYGIYGQENPFRMDVNDALAAVATGNVKDLCAAAQAQMTAPGAGPSVCQDAACTSNVPVAFVLYSTGQDRVPNLKNAQGTRLYESNHRGIDASGDVAADRYDDQVVSYPLSSLVAECAQSAGSLPTCNATSATVVSGLPLTFNVPTNASCSNSPTAYTWTFPADFQTSVTGTGTSASITVTAPTNNAALSAAGLATMAVSTVGATATASSTFSANFPVEAVNNNERDGAGWGTASAAINGGWNDSNAGGYPDWLQITFSGQKTIDRVVVYTVQDTYTAPLAPSDDMTFTLYGLIDFVVQGWDGASWVTLGAPVVSNNLVKRTISFTPYTTDRIRIYITNANGYTRINEVEAWAASTDYTYTLSGTNELGKGVPASAKVTVLPATCTLASASVTAGSTATFTPSCNHLPTQYSWWVDGSAVTGTSSYTTVSTLGVGTHTVMMRARNAGGGIGVASATLTVTAAVAPTASNVSISGTVQVGQTLTGTYTYSDANNDPQGTSTFRWLRNGVAIAGATASTYTLVAADQNATIAFEVTPVSTVAPTTGTPVVSSATLTVNAACTAQPSGLVSWWRGNGDATDAVGSTSGTLQGSATYATGKVGQAFSLNGSANTYVNITDLSNTLALTGANSAHSVAAWFNASSMVNGAPIYNRRNSGNGAGMTLELTSPNRITYYLNIGGWKSISSTIVLNQWNNVVGTYDGANMRLYINGTEVASSAVSGNIAEPASPSIWIGRNVPGYNTYFNGLIDEMQIYNRALSTAEISTVYNAGSAGVCP